MQGKGRLTLADMCVGPAKQTTMMTWALKAAAVLFSVPYDNMVTSSEYSRQLIGAGFVDVKIQDVSADVFQGT